MDLLKRNSNTLLVVFLFGLSLQLSSVSIKYPSFPKYGWKLVSFITSPVQELIHESIETTTFVWNKYIWLQSLYEKNQFLELENQELKYEKNKLLELKFENQRLSSLLQYKENTTNKQIVANVIGRDPSNWSMTIKIDKGLNNGILIGNPVINGDGLVGRVSHLDDTHSVVLLLTDPSSSIGALSQNTRTNGIVEGTFSSEFLRLNFVENSLSSQVELGERVVTSGLDGVFPKGILVGYIKDIKEDTGGLFKNIEVTPAINFRKIETVMILTE